MKETLGKRETTMPEREILIGKIIAASQWCPKAVKDAAMILSSKRLGVFELRAVLTILEGE